MMDSIIIRSAVPDDAGTIADLARQLGYPTSTAQSAVRLAALLDSGDNAVFVACLPNGDVVGWVHVFHSIRLESDPFAELGGFIVAQALRRSGIGMEMLSAAEKWAVQHGIETLRVRTRFFRKGAHRFYERMGFSKSKEQFVFDKLLDIDAECRGQR